MEIGENIKRIREIKGITQKELAEKTGLSVTAIHDIEYGLSTPRTQNLQKIAEILGVSVFEIIPQAPETYSRQLFLISTDDLLEELKRRIKS